MKPQIQIRKSETILLAAAILGCQFQLTYGAEVAMNLSDAINTSSFDTGLHWADGQPPSPGNTYRTANFLLRTPQNTTPITFLGDSLLVQAGGSLRSKTAATVTIANLLLTNTAVLEMTQPAGVNNNTAAGSLEGAITLLGGSAIIRSGISSDVAGETFTITSTISGPGGFTTSGSNGRIILTGNNTYGGGTTLAGLANSRLELGNASAVSNSVVTISLANGLDFSPGIGTFHIGGLAGLSNETLDDTAGTAVTLVAGGNGSNSTYGGVLSGLGSLTKVGTGTLTLNNSNSYAGVTTVSAGKLVVSTAGRLGDPGAVVVSDAAALGVSVSGTNQLSLSSLTLGSSAGATNEFLAVASTTIVPVTITALTLNGTATINAVSGNFVAGNSYPLLNYTTLSGGGNFALGTLPTGVTGNLSVSGNTVYANVTSVSTSIWTGATNGNWNIGGTANWSISGIPSVYANGAMVQFDDTGTNTSVNIVATVSPGSTTVSNSSKTYSFSGSAISGNGGLTKAGNGLLILSNLNTYLGSTVVGNGTVQLGVDNAIPAGAGKGDVNLAGGTLDLNTHSQTLNGLSGSGTVDTIAGGAPVLTIGSNDVSSTFSGVIKNTAGALALTKVGSGAFTLQNTNTYSGPTRIEGGTLVVGGGAGQTLFALTNSNTTLRFSSNYVSAAGVSLSANTADAGETVAVDPGVEAVIQGLLDGNNGQSTWFRGGGTLRLTNSISAYNGRLRLNNLTLIIDNDAVLTQSSANAQASQIGSGSVPNTPANSTGTLTVRGNGQYVQTAVGLRIGSDANGAVGILNVQGNALVSAPQLFLPRQTGNTGTVNQVGGTVVTPNLSGGHTGATIGGLYFWEGTYNLNGGTLAWGGILGAGTGPTVPEESLVLNLNGGTLQLTADASINGWTAINVMSNRAIIDTISNLVAFDQPLVAGDAADGGLTKLGSGTLTLNAANAYAGGTTVSNGTLLVNGSIGSGAVTVANGATLGGIGTINSSVTVRSGGTLSAGSSIGSLTISNLIFTAGSTNLVEVDLDTQTSDQVIGLNSVTYAGTLVVSNVGITALTNGAIITLFNAINYSGAFTSFQPPTPGPGLAWDTSGLITSGQLRVVAGTPSGPTISSVVQSGGNLVMISTGVTSANQVLSSSTNVAAPLATWTPVTTNAVGPDGRFTNTIPINSGEPQRFFILSIP